MIRIQLAPYSELEDKQWWVPDVALLVVAGFFSSFFFQSYVDRLKSDIVDIETQTTELTSNIKLIEPELKAFQSLQSQIDSLKAKISALSSITVSKISKYKSVLLLEQLQILKPEGVWFETMKEESMGKSIQITGFAFDPILVGQFMSDMGATKLQQADPTDMRSLLFYENINLKTITSERSGSVLDEVQPLGFAKFDLTLRYSERTLPSPAPESPSVIEIKKSPKTSESH